MFVDPSLRRLMRAWAMVLAVDSHAQSQLPPLLDEDIDFSFLPSSLLEKCKPFIVRYHELNGFSSLPDILWHPETRKFN
jgi:hypothetical protein